MKDRDDVIELVEDFCKTAWPESPNENERVKKLWEAKASTLKKFWSVSHELTVNHGLLLYNSRIVIPESLQADILSKIHEGHQGIVKYRAMAKTSVWWPGL
ncbi:Pol polyprotein [Elysia marginata]|uniref:Pol polyprotein n=1 Tax=Elysia marginata TaxID=1093978 RepID=A0AAV4EG02_9GAST|nr:Pol polyprotein [Elysia marginata]